MRARGGRRLTDRAEAVALLESGGGGEAGKPFFDVVICTLGLTAMRVIEAACQSAASGQNIELGTPGSG